MTETHDTRQGQQGWVIDPRYVVRNDLWQAELIDAIRWLCTEMPVNWEEIANAEGRTEIVETVRKALMSDVPDECYVPYRSPDNTMTTIAELAKLREAAVAEWAASWPPTFDHVSIPNRALSVHDCTCIPEGCSEEDHPACRYCQLVDSEMGCPADDPDEGIAVVPMTKSGPTPDWVGEAWRMTDTHDERTTPTTDLAARIGFLKSLCDWLTIANVHNDDAPEGFSWEVVGICENDGTPEEVVSGHGHSVTAAVTDAIQHAF